MERNGALWDDLITALEAVLKDESELLLDEGEAAAINEVPAWHESRQIESFWTNDEDVISREIWSATKKLGMIELSTMTEKLLEDIQSM